MKESNLFFYDLVALMAKLVKANDFSDAALDFTLLGEIKESYTHKPEEKGIPMLWGVGNNSSGLFSIKAFHDMCNRTWVKELYEITCNENDRW